MIKFILALLTLGAGLAQSKKVWIDTNERIMRDEYGRHTIFHGVNVVYKVAPYIPDQEHFDGQDSLTDQDIQDLADWGFNFVRLGVMWEAVETSPGVYNETYLQEIDKLITKLGEQGIYTLVDAHQDVLARVTCGEGMPDFYAKQVIAGGTFCIGPIADHIIGPIARMFGVCKSIDDYGFRKDANGNPLIEDCQTQAFGQFYTSPEALTLFRSFYYNHYEIQDKYVDYWQYVSQKLSQNPYVVGFDPFNEPIPGAENLGGLLKMLLPGNFDKYQLQPMYERIFGKYKEASSENIMMFEPSQFPDAGPIGSKGMVNHLGFTEPPGAKFGSANHVLNDHDYCGDGVSNCCDDSGVPFKSSEALCLAWHQKKIGMRNQDAQKLGIPFILSEFGACLNTEECATEIRQIADVSDENLNGWAYWQFKRFEDLTTTAGNKSEGFYSVDGSIESIKVKALTRTYVKSAQGQILKMNFNSTSGVFSASIKIDSQISQPTEIHAFMDKSADYAWYPNGVAINLSTGTPGQQLPDVQQNILGNTISLQVTTPQFDGEILNVQIVPSKM